MILIIENDLRMLGLYLSWLGWIHHTSGVYTNVVVASGDFSALYYLDPRVVILDIHLEETKESWSILEYWNLLRVPVVVVSGAAGTDDFDTKARQLGAKECLAKPISRDTFVKSILEFIK